MPSLAPAYLMLNTPPRPFGNSWNINWPVDPTQARFWFKSPPQDFTRETLDTLGTGFELFQKTEGSYFSVHCSENQISFSLHNCHQETICLKNKWSWQIGLSRHKNKNWRFFSQPYCSTYLDDKKTGLWPLVIFSPHVNKIFQMFMFTVKMWVLMRVCNMEIHFFPKGHSK